MVLDYYLITSGDQNGRGEADRVRGCAVGPADLQQAFTGVIWIG